MMIWIGCKPKPIFIGRGEAYLQATQAVWGKFNIANDQGKTHQYGCQQQHDHDLLNCARVATGTLTGMVGVVEVMLAVAAMICMPTDQTVPGVIHVRSTSDLLRLAIRALWHII